MMKIMMMTIVMVAVMTMMMRWNGEDSHPRPASTTGEKSSKPEDDRPLIFLR